MIYASESKTKGLTISLEINDLSKRTVLESLLNSLNCGWSASQPDSVYVHYRVSPKDAPKVRTIVEGWYLAISDLQYAMDLRVELL